MKSPGLEQRETWATQTGQIGPEGCDSWGTRDSEAEIKKKKFLDDLSNSTRPFDYMVKAGQAARQKVFPGRYAPRKIRKSHVDSRPSCSTNKWSGSAQPGTRNIPCPVRPTLLYKSSGPDMASAQHSKEKKMRFMMIMFPKSYVTAKPGTVPDFKDMEAMGKYNEELGKAGVLQALDGLTPPATMSARVTFKNGKSKVTDGPFTEAKEVVGGYWIIQVKSREEALEWASRIPGKDNEMVEVRRMFDLTDFDPETQKYIQEKFGDDVAAEMRQ
jgi:hypothetical protein